MIDLNNLTIQKAHEAMKKGEYSPLELANAYKKNIEEKNKELNVFIEVFDDIEEQSKKAEKMFKDGQDTLLTGIPFAVKDNMLILGHHATAGSKILGNYTAVYDSTVIELLKKEGAIFLGRTNMDEFAMGSSTETSYYNVTKNPIDPTRVPGGSSGGSTAAVASDMALVSLGSDTGGSIRQPAAFCGLVGLKTTYGALSRYGLIALASSLDQIGPMTKTVSESEIIFNALNKHDSHDSTSLSTKERDVEKKPLKKRIGVPVECLKIGGIEPDVLANFNQAVEKLRGAGYTIVDISLPLMPYSLAVYYILQPAEASSNLARFDGIRYGFSAEGENLLEVYKKTRGEGFGKETRRRILLGTYVLSHGYYDAYYNKALKVQKEITKEFEKAFQDVDAIITPTTPSVAFKIGAKSQDPVQMYLSDIFTVPANIAGIPAISVPSGTGADNLPLGIQFMAPYFREDILFEIGKEYEGLV